MKRSRTYLYLMITDWIILSGSFAVGFHFRPYDPGLNIVSRYHMVPEMSMTLIYAFVILNVFSWMELYKRKTQLIPLQQLYSIFKAVWFTVLIYALLRTLTKSDLFIHSRKVMLYWGILAFGALSIHRLLIVPVLIKILSKTDIRRRVVVIGNTKLSEKFSQQCIKKTDCVMKVIGYMDNSEEEKNVTIVPYLGDIAELPEAIDLYNLDGAVICNPTLSHQKLMDLAENCIRLFGWVDVHSDNSLALQQSDNADVHFDIPFIRMHGIPNNALFKTWKRVFDFSTTLLGVLILSPVFIITAIAIKLTSPGPVFYTKERIGQNGTLFPFYKFRSMAVGADQDHNRNEQIKDFIQNQNEGETLNKIVNTAYVTPVGKFIRKWAIDELPQLFNVLKGDMALVGPRPVPQSEYEMEDEWHQRRFKIRPGCTGLWKLYSAKNGVTFNDTVLYDIYYSRNMNPAIDLMVIAGTIWVIFTGKADG